MAEPVSNYVISPHAAFEMARRRISAGIVRAVLAAPEQRHPVRPGRDVLQSKIEVAGKRIWFARSSMLTGARPRSSRCI
jgi:hypothetical protein